MKKRVIGLCSIILSVALMACGKIENVSADPSSGNFSQAEVKKELLMPIESLTWGMSKGDALTHLVEGVQEMPAEDGNTQLIVNQSVLGRNALVTLKFRQKTEDDYFDKFPEQYLVNMEFKYTLTDYDAIMQQLTQKYGSQWRQGEDEEKRIFWFGSYKIADIQDENVKKQAVAYIAAMKGLVKYREKAHTSLEQIWNEMSQEDREGYELAVLECISLEVPRGEDYFYVKAAGELMLPVANANTVQKCIVE